MALTNKKIKVPEKDIYVAKESELSKYKPKYERLESETFVDKAIKRFKKLLRVKNAK